MSDLAALKVKLNHALMISETNLYTEEKRTFAINTAIEDTLLEYPIPQYILAPSLSFSSGSVALPTDCLRPIKLFNATSLQEYDLIDPGDFDSNISNTATIKYDTGTSAEKIYIYNADTVTLTFRYLQMPAYLSSPSDTVKFPIRWDLGIVTRAASYLLQSSRNFDIAQAKAELAKNLLAKAWQQESARYQGKYGTRLKSVYESRLLLTRNYGQ